MENVGNGQKICSVCEAGGARHHYGGLCCSGCKGFFRRTIRAKITYNCPYENNCAISKEYRNCCRACRLQKCFSKGMKQEMVMMRKVNGDQQQARKTAPQGAPNTTGKSSHFFRPPPPTSTSNSASSSSLALTPAVTTNSLFSSNFSNEYNNNNSNNDAHVFGALLLHYQRLNTGSRSKLALGFFCSIPRYSPGDCASIARYFVSVERLCDLFFDTQFVYTPIPAPACALNTELPAEIAFKEPGLVTGRFPVSWSPPKYIVSIGVLSQSFCRCIVHYFDWTSHVPELWEFSESDRLQLVLKRFMCSMSLQNGFRSAQLPISAITFGSESYYPMDRDKLPLIDKRLINLFGNTLEMIMEELVKPMQELAVSEEEYVLLRIICLFTPVPRLSDHGLHLLDMLQNKYLCALSDLVLSRRDQHPSGISAQKRLQQMLMMLPVVEQMGQMDKDRFTVNNLFNLANMHGTLLYQLIQ